MAAALSYPVVQCKLEDITPKSTSSSHQLLAFVFVQRLNRSSSLFSPFLEVIHLQGVNVIEYSDVRRRGVWAKGSGESSKCCSGDSAELHMQQRLQPQPGLAQTAHRPSAVHCILEIH